MLPRSALGCEDNAALLSGSERLPAPPHTFRTHLTCVWPRASFNPRTTVPGRDYYPIYQMGKTEAQRGSSFTEAAAAGSGSRDSSAARSPHPEPLLPPLLKSLLSCGC